MASKDLSSGIYIMSRFRSSCISALSHQGLCPGHEVIELFSCSTQLSMKFVLLINLKLLTIANSFLLKIAEHEDFSANKFENANNKCQLLLAFSYLLAEKISCSAELSM